MADTPTTELMALWDRLGFDVRTSNALKRHYYRWDWSDRGKWERCANCPDSVERFLADLALPFDESPLRYVPKIGKTMYRHMQEALNRA